MNRKKSSYFIVSILFVLSVSTSCGVKGPPLPPIVTTPQESDLKDGTASDQDESAADPTQTESSPSPAKKGKAKSPTQSKTKKH